MSGKEFKCHLPDDVSTLPYRVVHESEECVDCAQSHEEKDKDKTPGCLMVNSKYACLKPNFFEEAPQARLVFVHLAHK